MILAGLVIDAIASDQLRGMQPVGMFELAWLGVPATITGLLYLIFIAPRLLRETKTLGASIPISREYLSEFRVLPVGRLASR